MTFEEIYEASSKEYKSNYSSGEYCHEQSFKWGWQEGVNWLLSKLKDIDDNIIVELAKHY